MFQDAATAHPDVSRWNTTRVTNMESMFEGASAATPDMSNWDFSNVTNMNYMFAGLALPVSVYSDMLLRIFATTKQQGVVLHAGSSHYNADAAQVRHQLVAERDWVISDGGRVYLDIVDTTTTNGKVINLLPPPLAHVISLCCHERVS